MRPLGGYNEYLYFVHGYGRDRRMCYLGAKDRYEHFNRVEDMGLKGLGDPKRHLEYLRSCVLGFVDEASKLMREARRVVEEALVKLKDVEEALSPPERLAVDR